MDVESLAKQLILKNMTPEQQTAVLDSIRASVSQAKDVQKQRIGENVRMVVEALKKIEADIKTRYDETGKAIEKRVASIKDGKDGKDGVNGKDGRDGRPGKDGDTGPRGADGLNGANGRDGEDGVSVTDAHIDFDGSLIISLSSGRVINVGEVVAPDLAEKIKVITNGGGTSQVVIDTLASLQTQINNLIPSQTGNYGKFLTTDGTNLSWSSVAGGLSYQGTWNASTNTPTLTSSVGVSGYYYITSTAGSTNLNGITDWQVGDWLLFNGTVWQKIDQSEVLQTIASADSSVTVTTTGSNADLSVYSSPRLISQVRNETGATLTKGTVVYISGAAGNKATVSKAIATSDSTSAQTFGLVLSDISNNNNGYAILAGDIAGLDTSAFAAGTQLYLSSTTAGTYTSTKQYAPNHLVYIGVVTRSHANQGSIEVRIQNGYEMDELHNVSAQSPSNGQSLVYNTSTSLWEKNTVSLSIGVNGTLPIANGGTGATTRQDAMDALAGSTTSGQYLRGNGTDVVMSAIQATDVPTLNQSTTGNAATATTATNVSGGTASVTTLTTSSTVTLNGGTANGVAYLNGSKVVTSGSALTFDGTTFVAPLTSLSGNGVVLTVDRTGTGGNDRTNVQFSNSGTVRGGIGTLGAADGIYFNQGTTEGMRLTSTGLGIGTSSPAQKLHVANAGGIIGLIQNTASTADARLRVQNTQAYLEVGQDGTGGYLQQSGAYPLVFYTNSAERMRLESSGNLGLGVTPSAWSGYKAFQINRSSAISSASGSDALNITANSYYNGTNWIYSASYFATRYTNDDGTHKWYNAPSGTAGNAITWTQAMTLDASGNLLVGTTSAGSRVFINGDGTNPAFRSHAATSNTSVYAGIFRHESTTSGAYIQFLTDGSVETGRIYDSGGTMQYASSSDARLKTNVQPLQNGLSSVLAMNPCTYNIRRGESATISSAGLIAQEVYEIYPYAVGVGGDDENTNPWSVDYGKLTPLLIKAIKEQQAIIESLKARLDAANL